MAHAQCDNPERLSESHQPALTGWRGVAILLVLLYHFVDARPVDWSHKLLFRFVTAGWTGVDLFFVLSGFLITGILCDTRKAPFYYRAFYMRRLLRIQPIYLLWMSCLLLLLSQTWIFGESISGRQIAAIYGMFVNWSLLWFPHQEVTGMAWSLSVEEHFYILWPFLVRRCSHRHLAAILLLIVFAAGFIRTLAVFWSAPQAFIDFNTFTRCDSLAIGGLLALAQRTPLLWERWSSAAPSILIGVGICLAGLSACQEFQLNPAYRSTRTLGYSLLAVFWASVLTLALQKGNRANLAQRIGQWRPLQWLGRYSYAIYLFNPAVLVFLQHHMWSHWHLPASSAAQLLLPPVLGIGLTLSLAVLSWKLVEERMLRFKGHFSPWGSLPPELPRRKRPWSPPLASPIPLSRDN